MQGDGNDRAPDHGFEEGEDDPDAPGNEQEKDNDPEDGVDQRRFNGLVHRLISTSLELDVPAEIPRTQSPRGSS